MPESIFRPRALLLIGPTGAGKTPFGEAAARSGLWNLRCLHFDFGAHLRQAGECGFSKADLSNDDYKVINRVLATGELLADRDFSVASKILNWFLRTKRPDSETLVLLNGLPRHVGQAVAVDKLVDVRIILELRCSLQVVLSRIRKNTGGDRSGRRDDSIAEIQNKLTIYEQRTSPLLDYYRLHEKISLFIDVNEDMSPQEMLACLESQQTVKSSLI
jgi:adenylate kinase